MNVSYLFAFVAVVVLILLAWAGVGALGMTGVFGILVPYAAMLLFVVGFARKILDWSNSYVPFRIPTTCGQQKSLPWIRQNKIDNPNTTGGVIVRMLLEILLFRSLFRNTKAKFKDNHRLSYRWEIVLWVAALAFHYAFAVTLLRHLRFFFEPVPMVIQLLESADAFFRVEFFSPYFVIGLPGVYASGLVLLGALLVLLGRRIFLSQVRYISLAADFFPLFLIIGIAASGILMRYFAKVDITAIKTFAMGLVTFKPVPPDGVGALFYVHLFLVSVLTAYFPFSKLMHAGGVFLSPTRNMANNNRAVRHVNPWNYSVHTHTYDEYEEEFREKMIEAGLPVEKEQ
ncbi:MAG: sulfate reduction electron transfer complex DsrMKJOP subunit DsrM [Thermodesulfobacteriota bacterium]|nr:sulfate reduction electron transfer complex DsrMKJOP subunit DsrM [Thermodesulfobacteriota bacterium]